MRIGGGRGAQTVFPGSTHKETGEAIIWEQFGEPVAVDDYDLLRSVHDLGAYSLIARYWPKEHGTRHQCALILGGFLARAGKSAPEIKIIAEAIAKATNDEEWRDRRNSAEDAAIAYQAGERTYGLPAMREQFGGIVADQVAEWLGYNFSSECEPEREQPAETPPVGLEVFDARDDIELPPPRGWLLAYGSLA